MEIFIYVLISIIMGFITYAFWCYSYTCSAKTSSFYNYMHKNYAYDWVFFCAVLWPLALLGIIFIGICLSVFIITSLIRRMFKINE